MNIKKLKAVEFNGEAYFKITETKKKTSELLDECRALFPVDCYLSNDDLDKQFPPPDKITTRYFEKNIEADEKHKNNSANDCERKGIKGITLRERILMELQYFKDTGKHLDINNITLCSGSRDFDGGVPLADWCDRKFRVDWDYADYRGGYLRPREVVSLNTFTSNTSDETKKLNEAISVVKNAGYKVIKEI